MKKSIFILTSSLILLSVVGKLTSFLVRIILARKLSTDAMSLYSLVSPTMIIFITIAQMGIPSALSKVMAQNDQYQKPMFSALFFTLINTIFTVIIFTLLIPFLSKHLFHDTNIAKVLFSILPLIPLVALSGLCKGYLLGKRKHILSTSSQLIEEGSRIIFLMLIFKNKVLNNPYDMASIAMLSVSIGEFFSSVYMMICMKIKKNAFLAFPHSITTLKKNDYLQIFTISMPMTYAKIIGSVTYFLEPIMMLLLIKPDAHDTIIRQYGILNGYLLPILTMPSFLTITLSNMLLPAFTYRIHHHDGKNAKRLCLLILLVCLLIGFCCSSICFLFPEKLLFLFYHQTYGYQTLKLLSIPFCLYALQPALAALLHALSYSKKAMWDTLYGSIIRLTCISLLTPYFGSIALSIGLCTGMCFTTLLHITRLLYLLKQKNNEF